MSGTVTNADTREEYASPPQTSSQRTDGHRIVLDPLRRYGRFCVHAAATTRVHNPHLLPWQRQQARESSPRPGWMASRQRLSS
jgi:hypothetical protein